DESPGARLACAEAVGCVLATSVTRTADESERMGTRSARGEVQDDSSGGGGGVDGSGPVSADRNTLSTRLKEAGFGKFGDKRMPAISEGGFTFESSVEFLSELFSRATSVAGFPNAQGKEHMSGVAAAFVSFLRRSLLKQRV
ncbi:unnamed protein product, partial [Chrysoparadoxa australica]